MKLRLNCSAILPFVESSTALPFAGVIVLVSQLSQSRSHAVEAYKVSYNVRVLCEGILRICVLIPLSFRYYLLFHRKTKAIYLLIMW